MEFLRDQGQPEKPRLPIATPHTLSFLNLSHMKASSHSFQTDLALCVPATIKRQLRSVSEKWLFACTNRNMQLRSIAQLQHIVCKILSPTHCPCVHETLQRQGLSADSYKRRKVGSLAGRPSPSTKENRVWCDVHLSIWKTIQVTDHKSADED
jgi:hypothetical protein